MTSIPQLRKDINDLQDRLADMVRQRDDALALPRGIQKVYVDREVPGPERVVMVSGPAERIVKTVEVPVEVIRTVEVIKEVPVEIVRTVEVIKEVPVEVVRTVEVTREVPVEVIKTVEVQLPPERIVKVVEVPVEVVRTVEVPGTERINVKKVYVDRPVIEYRDVIKEVPGPVETVIKTVEVLVEVIRTVEVPGPERLVYVDNPAHIEMIRKLRAGK